MAAADIHLPLGILPKSSKSSDKQQFLLSSDPILKKTCQKVLKNLQVPKLQNSTSLEDDQNISFMYPSTNSSKLMAAYPFDNNGFKNQADFNNSTFQDKSHTPESILEPYQTEEGQLSQQQPLAAVPDASQIMQLDQLPEDSRDDENNFM